MALHDLILKNVLSQVNFEGTEGRKVSYVGCYTVTRPSQVLITPVSVTIE